MATRRADDRAVHRLEPYRECLTGAASRQQSFRFIATTWRAWLSADQAAGGKLDRSFVDTLLAEFPDDRVSRADLRRLAKEADDDRARLRLFVATLIWGRGTSNGRMLPNMMKAVRSEHRDDVLRRTAACAVAGELAEGFRAWTLSGLRAPFFTKWLWASSSHRTLTIQPLVLDRRVWASLEHALGWNSIEAAGSNRCAERYAAYVGAVHRWAEVLSEAGRLITAEDIECGLFAAAGDLSRLALRQAGANNNDTSDRGVLRRL